MSPRRQKREHSPTSGNANASKRARTSKTPPDPEVIVISDDEDLTTILAFIKEQEESERLAKELSQQWNGSSSSAEVIDLQEDGPIVATSSNKGKEVEKEAFPDVINIDDDEALARRLQKEWENEDRLSANEASSHAEPSVASEDTTPDEVLERYRSLFTAERPCTKCKGAIPSPRGYVVFKSDEEIIQPTLGLLLHASCSFCSTNYCRGCFTPLACRPSCKGKASNPKCTVHLCCAEIRAIALFEVLGAFDRQYIGERANSQSRASDFASKNKGASSSSVGPGGTGYGAGNYSSSSTSYGGWQGRGRGRGGGRQKFDSREVYFDDLRNKELAAHFEEITARALHTVTTLLPSPYTDSMQAFDLLPHPSIGRLLSLSKLPELLGDLLRNDSVTDWAHRNNTYNAMLALLRRMADCELTVQVLLEPRWQMSKGQGIEDWMWGDVDIQWARNSEGKVEHAPALYEHFKKLRKQSQAFLSGASELMDSEDNAEEIITATSLCCDILAAGDDIERTITVLGSSTSQDTASASISTIKSKKGKERDSNVNLEHVYSQACEQLAFQHISLGTEDGNGWQYPNYNFSGSLKETQNSTRNPKDRLYLVKELAVMATSLPPGIWVRVDEVRNDCIKVMIAGPDGTPYAGGLFEFDCFMPINYPQKPPQMHLRTTGGGSVRFNPNLYDSGKVCLSLLGTWSGSPEEQWAPYKSTLLQVLVSIQSMILIELPYFNEPGYGKADPNRQESIRYNKNIALQTTRWAIVEWLDEKHRNSIWADVIRSHFTIREDKIRKQIEEWSSKDPNFKKYASTAGYAGYATAYHEPGSHLPYHPSPSTGHRNLLEDFDKGITSLRQTAATGKL